MKFQYFYLAPMSWRIRKNHLSSFKVCQQNMTPLPLYDTSPKNSMVRQKAKSLQQNIFHATFSLEEGGFHNFLVAQFNLTSNSRGGMLIQKTQVNSKLTGTRARILEIYHRTMNKEMKMKKHEGDGDDYDIQQQ